MAHAPKPRSYGCSFGDGNPYDFVVVTVVDSTTLFLCAPCFVRTALEMVQALTDPDTLGTDIQGFMSDAADTITAPGPSGKTRGHNAPAEADDEDLIEAFDMVLTTEELGDEFK